MILYSSIAHGRYFKGNMQVYFAVVHTLGELPSESEMELIDFFDTLPNELTYPMLRDYFPLALEKKQRSINTMV